VIFNGAMITNYRSFYFNVLSQFTLYIGLTCNLESLYRTDEVLLNLTNVQGIQLFDSIDF
jgi:hypothetical protein